MSLSKPGARAAGTGRRSAAGGPHSWWLRTAGLAVTLAGTVLVAAACGGGSSPGPAASGRSLYARELAYSRCMRARSAGLPHPQAGT